MASEISPTVARASTAARIDGTRLVPSVAAFVTPSSAALHADALEPRVLDVPKEIDEEIARLKLATMGVTIDTLTEEQAKYLASWDEGT